MKLISTRICAGLLLAGLLAMPALPARAQTRAAQVNTIATIDLRKVFENYWKRQQAEAVLKDRGASLDKELKGFMDDYKKTQEEYNKLLATASDQSVTPEERDKRKTAAEAKLTEIKTSENTIRTFEENARDQLDSQKKRMRETILGEIRTAVNAKAKLAGYTLVFDTAADSINQTPVILYTNGENDLTEAVLAQLNIGAPPPSNESPKADTTSAPKK